MIYGITVGTSCSCSQMRCVPEQQNENEFLLIDAPCQTRVSGVRIKKEIKKKRKIFLNPTIAVYHGSITDGKTNAVVGEGFGNLGGHYCLHPENRDMPLTFERIA